jgi:CheY-like chemotaxis protein
MGLEPKTILCVDDDPSILRLRTLLFQSANYSVLTAGSGAEAVQLLADGTKVDLVLLDYLMPGMNGDELAARLRERYPNLPLIAVSAVPDLPREFLQNVNQRVPKGENPQVLLAAVAAILEQTVQSQGKSQPISTAPTILCVEDEQLQLQARKMLLESAGFKVLEARSAGAALDIFRTHPVDVVVMDYWLPGTNGTATAEEMKRINPKTPIIMFSAFASLPGEGAVVDAWLRKGDVKPEHLLSEVKRLIRGRAERAAQSE